MKEPAMTDSGISLPPDNRIHLFDPVGLINQNYGGYNIIKQRRTTPKFNHDDSVSTTTSTNGGQEGFRFDTNMMDDELIATASPSPPPSRKSNPPTSPKAVTVSSPLSPKAASSPPRLFQSTSNHAQNLSPKSRTQAIARGRKEMMEMIKDMPESFFELSLKDIVERKPASVDQNNRVTRFANDFDQADKLQDKKNPNKKSSKKKKMKKSESRVKMAGSGSIDNGGFLLKTSVFPISLGSKKNKKKKTNSATSAGFKVAPILPLPTISNGSPGMKGTDKDWRKKSCISREGDSEGLSSGSSSHSNSNSRQKHNNRFLPSCFSIFNGKRIKPRK